MSEKVKVTRNQAEAIERLTAEKHNDVKHHIAVKWDSLRFESLNELTTDQFIRALYIGYEVEEEFKVGDWVVITFELHTTIYGKTKKIADAKDSHVAGHDICFDLDDSGTVYQNEIRHATPEEIAEEKERRWWSSHGREVWELRKGDLLISNTDRFSCDVKFVESSDKTSTLLVNGIEDELLETKDKLKEKYTVLCFVENRLDGDY